MGIFDFLLPNQGNAAGNGGGGAGGNAPPAINFGPTPTYAQGNADVNFGAKESSGLPNDPNSVGGTPGTVGSQNAINLLNTVGPGTGGTQPKPPAAPTQPSSGVNPNDAGSIRNAFPGYAGWSDPAIIADFKATGGNGKGGSSGGSGGTDEFTQQLNAGYDTYNSQLNDIMNNSLPQQQASGNQVALNNYNMGVGDMGTAQQNSLDQINQQGQNLQTQQAKNLTGISDNLRNMFMAGNVYLGSRGAGDSSAANQYAYALQKVGNQARGDQMGQTAQLQSQLDAQANGIKSVYTQNLKDLQTSYSNATQQVAQWFAQAQDSLKQAIAQGAVQKGTDLANHSASILAQSQQMLATVKQNATNQYNSLLTWAENNSKTVGQLRSNLQGAVQNVGLQSPTSVNGQITPDAQGGFSQNPMAVNTYNASGSTTNKNNTPLFQSAYNQQQ
jgi:hypothetical protein